MKHFFLLWACFFILGTVSSQEERDLKVGLVLSGGGAKGLAHIGALQVIEEAGVRIDYIGGTSMGAIIGGLYASGYSAKELDSIFSTVNFEELIQDDLPRKAKTFYEKENDEKYAITLPFDRFRISLPTSLSKGQNVYNLMYQLTSHVSHINEFAEMPIPFFCIATDVESGKEVLLNKGHLPQAMSASGALPSLFSPMEVNGQILIDGGVTNNYPVDEVREMGADVIIGIDVQDSLITRENLKSAIDVMVQINNYRTINAMREKRKKTDVYIHPYIRDYSVISFDKGDEIIAAGKKQALLQKEALQAIAEQQKPAPPKSIRKIRSDSLVIDAVSISGNQDYTRSYILGKLKLQPPEKTTYTKFSEGINNLSATGNFSQINYNFSKKETDKNTLHLSLSENKTRNLFRLGVHYDDLYKSAALLNFSRKRLLSKNDIASLDVILGDNIRYNFDYYIDKGYYWSIGVKSSYNKFKKNVRFALFPPETIEGITSVANIEVKHQTVTNQFYVQTLFQQIFALRLGGEHKHLKLETETLENETGNPTTIFENTNYFSAFGSLRLDSRDNKYFPKSGLFFEGNFNFYLYADGENSAFDQFSIAKANMGYAFRLFKKMHVNVTSSGGFKIGGQETNTLDFFAGGYGFKPVNNFVHLYGYDAFSLRGDTFLKSTLRLDYPFYRKNYISTAINIANVGDALFESTAWIDNIPQWGYAVGLSSESFLGPLEVLYSYSPVTEQSQWYVSLGFWF